MTNQLLQENVDLWEAWIDTEIPGKYGHGTLHVIGEVATSKKSFLPKIRKADSGLGSSDILHLEVCFCELGDNGRVEEVIYSEALKKNTPYQKIVITINNEVVNEINEIEYIV